MKKSKKVVDPFLEREKLRYGEPIPSRECILNCLEEHGAPAYHDSLVKILGLKKKSDQEALRKRLRAMVRDGQLMLNRKGQYCLISKVDLMPGFIQAHPDGYGFFTPREGGEDLYISARYMRGVLHGDKVVVREITSPQSRRREGVIVEILERPLKTVVGRIAQQDQLFFLIPDNKRISQPIVLMPSEVVPMVPNQIVVVELVSKPLLRSELVGRVTEVLGDHMAPGMEIDVAIHTHGLPYRWPGAVLSEVQKFQREEVHADDVIGRVDLRSEPFLTIDGDDAKDFDDAVFCRPRRIGGGWILYVAIADVSHYVRLETALDKEAYERGNSVYFPGRVIPMLPEVLSNNLCSLNPDVDRLCMVCEATINRKGEITKFAFHEAVIRSRARLTYDKVAKMLEGDEVLQKRYTHVLEHVQNLYALYKLLHQTRQKRGAIDFDLRETKIVFSKDKKIRKIVPLIRNDAHRLIEECMLVANVCAARFLAKHKVATLYRVHVPPLESKMAELREFLGEFGLQLKGGESPQPEHYCEVLNKIQNKPEKNLIQTVLLRSLSQAVYSPDNQGHFGLAYDAYLHFTSPIRRYPDLLVHRAIKHLIKQGYRKKPFYYNDMVMSVMGEHCSITERRADDATRDVVDWLKCEYMSGFEGKIFDGVITSVTAFGLFVELKEVFVEGLVHVTALKDDYYHYDPLRHQLLGERTRTCYRLGDDIRVRVVRVSLDDKKIDFDLV